MSQSLISGSIPRYLAELDASGVSYPSYVLFTQRITRGVTEPPEERLVGGASFVNSTTCRLIYAVVHADGTITDVGDTNIVAVAVVLAALAAIDDTCTVFSASSTDFTDFENTIIP